MRLPRIALAALLGVAPLLPSCTIETDSCVAEGTLIETPEGPVAIENLRVGDRIFTVDVATGERVASTLTAVRAATRECVRLEVGERALRCTSDHPLFDPLTREWAPAGDWVLGRRDVLSLEGRGALVTLRSPFDGLSRVFDLSVEGPHHNFIAAGVLVHNKSYIEDFGDTSGAGDASDTSDAGDASDVSDAGDASDGGEVFDTRYDTWSTCVAEGSLVETPDGPRPIETLAVGDVIFAVDVERGERVATPITAVRSAVRECVRLEVGDTALRCTSDHPLYDPAAREWAPAGDWILGRRDALALAKVGLVEAPVSGRESFDGMSRVFDLTVASEHHNFIASGVLVHNKSDTEGELDTRDVDGGSASSVRFAIEVNNDISESIYAQLNREDGQVAWVTVTDAQGERVWLDERCEIPDCGGGGGVCGAALPMVRDITGGGFTGSIERLWDGVDSRVSLTDNCETRVEAPAGSYTATFCFSFQAQINDTEGDPTVGVAGEVISPTCRDVDFSLPLQGDVVFPIQGG